VVTVPVVTVQVPTAVTVVEPTPTSAAPTSAPAVTQTQPVIPGAVTVSLEAGTQGYTTEVVEAVPASADGPYWLAMPKYTVLSLKAYPVAKHLMQPQIFIYPANELAAANEEAGKTAVNLQALLKTQQLGKAMPFLPLYNAAQVMYAQVKFLDTKNGKGVRYLTQFDQAVIPINNYELLYTFQGLTNDGKYYVAAVLPVTMDGLPDDDKVTGKEPTEFENDFSKYREGVVNAINQAADNSFGPDLSKLDKMVQSIEVK
jgi:hypothetical protein